MDPKKMVGNAFYCSADNTISYDSQWIRSLYSKNGPFVAASILEHELGHAFNNNSSHEGGYSQLEENQADCIAGMEGKYGEVSGLVSSKDIVAAAIQFLSIGDDSSAAWWTFGRHGTAYMRIISYLTGVNQGLVACRAIGETPTGQVIQLGAFTIPLDQGLIATKTRNGYRVDYGNQVMSDLGSFKSPTETGSNGGILVDPFVKAYFSSGTYQLTEPVKQLAYPGADGSVKNVALVDLIKGKEQVWGSYYSQTLSGDNYAGLLLLVIRPGDQTLVIDTYQKGVTQVSSEDVQNEALTLFVALGRQG